MTFQKYNNTDLWFAKLTAPIWTTTVAFSVDNGALLPASNAVMMLVSKDSDWIVTQREIVHYTTRTWNSITGVTRAFAPVPKTDSATTTTQQPWDFTVDDTIWNYVWVDFAKDIQNEIERLETDKLDKDELRTWLWNNKILYTDSSWNETEIAIWATDSVLTSNWPTSAPSMKAVTVKVEVETLTKTVTLVEWVTVWDFVWVEDWVWFSMVDDWTVWGWAWDICIWDNWTKLYKLDAASISQHTLSTPYDVTTASYDNVSYDTSSIVWSSTYWMFLKPDWTKMYIASRLNSKIYQYTFSTPYDLSTLSYDGISLDVTPQNPEPYWLTFNPDWTKLYVVWTINDKVCQYNLSVAWAVWTAAYNNSLSCTTPNPTWITFKSDWTKMYLRYYNTTIVSQYNVPTPWDLTSVSTTVEAECFMPDKFWFWMQIWNSDTTLYIAHYSKTRQYKYWNALWFTLTNATIPWKIKAIWVANETRTAWQDVTLNLCLDDNQSWLSIWKDYYLSNTPWAISLTPWTNNVKVWVAISATEIFLNTPII